MNLFLVELWIVVYHSPLLETQFFEKIAAFFLRRAAHALCSVARRGADLQWWRHHFVVTWRGMIFFEMLIQLIQSISDLPGKP